MDKAIKDFVLIRLFLCTFFTLSKEHGHKRLYIFTGISRPSLPLSIDSDNASRWEM